MKLKEALSDVLPKELIGQLVRGFDVVGDVAIIIIPEQFQQYEKIIGDAILQNMSNVRIVAKRDGVYSGEYRLLPLKRIAGEGSFETIHKEYGLRYAVDPSLVYFSVRSGTERARVANLIQDDEEVLVLFSGIGPLPLMISKHSGARRIIGVEKNSNAIIFARKSLKLNKRIKNVSFLEGDVAEIVPGLKSTFSRVAMVLPQSGEEFLPCALPLIRNGGWLHFYDFQEEGEFAKSLRVVESAVKLLGGRVEESSVHKCGHIGPSRYRISVDSKIVWQ